MENNNWHEHDASYSSNGSYSSDEGYSKNKKRRNGVTLTQLVVCMLIVALLSGVAGAYFSDGLHHNSDQSALLPQNNGSVIMDNSKAATPSDAIPDNGGAQNGTSHPSRGLIIGGSNASGNTAGSNVIHNCMASVVGIYISQTTTTFSGTTSQEDTGSGSGVIITKDGYIVTNNHVVGGAGHIRVYLQDGTEYDATVVGADTYSDIAIIKINADNLPAATLGDSGSAKVGDEVYAIGNPLGVLTSSVSRGIISGLDRTITIDDVSMTLMQTDAAVNPGNSGGGLFNSIGELIGIVNAKSASIDVEGLGFAIPVNTAKPIIKNLIDLGYVTGRPYIGIEMQDVSLRYGNNQNSFNPFNQYDYVTRVQVMKVVEGSAANKAGIMANDILTAINGTEITGSSQFASLLYEYKVGDTVTITVLRGSESQDIPLTLGERS